MKKWIVLLLTLCLCLPAVACGEAAVETVAAVHEAAALPGSFPEISTFTDEELRVLLMQLQAEFAARGLAGTAQLPGGTYVGGLDLPVGSYVLACDGSSTDYQCGDLNLLSFHGEEEEYRLDEFLGNNHVYSYYVRLGEGDVLTLPYTHTISVYTGLQFQ
jgi:hypothetical protein